MVNIYHTYAHTLREEVSVRGSARSSASISVKTNLGFMSCTCVFIIGKNQKKKISSCASSSVKRRLQGKKSSRDMFLYQVYIRGDEVGVGGTNHPVAFECFSFRVYHVAICDQPLGYAKVLISETSAGHSRQSSNRQTSLSRTS